MFKRNRWVLLVVVTGMMTACSAAMPANPAEGTEAVAEAASTISVTEKSRPHVVLNQGTSQDRDFSGASGVGKPVEPKKKYEELLKNPEAMAASRIYGKETKNPEEIRLVFAGDILFDPSYAIMASLNQRGQGIEGGISADLLSIMREADIFMVNNEFPYTDRGTPTAGKKFTFRASPKYAGYLHDMGADIVSLANNHMYDYGEISLTDTLDTLTGIGMPYVGAGRNLSEAAQPVSFIANDQKISFISATQIERMGTPNTKGATETTAGVFRCLDPAKLLSTIEEAKKDSDFVIVYIHWGTESTDVIDKWQREQGPQIAAAGADLIIGDHPHVLQPIGYCGDTPVVYSLGNFLFNSRSLDSCLVEAVLDKNGLKTLRFIPARQVNCRVSLADGAEKERILEYMRKISPEAEIDAEGYVRKK